MYDVYGVGNAFADLNTWSLKPFWRNPHFQRAVCHLLRSQSSGPPRSD